MVDGRAERQAWSVSGIVCGGGGHISGEAKNGSTQEAGGRRETASRAGSSGRGGADAKTLRGQKKAAMFFMVLLGATVEQEVGGTDDQGVVKRKLKVC